MNKRKIVEAKITFSDGTSETYYDIDGTFSESPNSRKLAGFKNAHEWLEYHATWVSYREEAVYKDSPVEKQDRESLRGKAWCAQHQMEPGDCFKLHNAIAYSGRDVDFVKAVEKEINKTINELKSKASLYPEFSLDDLLEGYGNGNGRV